MDVDGKYLSSEGNCKYNTQDKKYLFVEQSRAFNKRLLQLKDIPIIAPEELHRKNLEEDIQKYNPDEMIDYMKEIHDNIYNMFYGHFNHSFTECTFNAASKAVACPKWSDWSKWSYCEHIECGQIVNRTRIRGCTWLNQKAFSDEICRVEDASNTIDNYPCKVTNCTEPISGITRIPQMNFIETTTESEKTPVLSRYAVLSQMFSRMILEFWFDCLVYW